jgi:hypothetical protein
MATVVSTFRIRREAKGLGPEGENVRDRYVERKLWIGSDSELLRLSAYGQGYPARSEEKGGLRLKVSENRAISTWRRSLAGGAL